MKKFLATSLAVLMLVGMLAACGGPQPAQPDATGTTAEADAGAATPDPAAAAPAGGGSGTLYIMSFTTEIGDMFKGFKDAHPEFPYEVNADNVVAQTDGAYQTALDAALVAGGNLVPDIYGAESAEVLRYTQGTMSQYAATYKALGIDVDAKIAAAEIAKYAVDIGTRDGEVVALPYQATGGAFIYRRSIAKDVWGTDDPAVIKTKIGPDWETFFASAEELKAKGYAIVSGDGDLWHPVENSSDQGWIVDGKLYLDPKREAFLDLSKRLMDNGYHNDTRDWDEPWYADMRGEGPKPTFGFYGPAWLINYTIGAQAPDTTGDWAICEPTIGFSWGGTWVVAHKDTDMADAAKQYIEWITLDTSDTGLQYQWANGMLNEAGTKDTVASAVVMAKSNGESAFLGGQNMFDIFIPAGANATGHLKTQYDQNINDIWRDQVRAYTAGNKDRDTAIADFKQNVLDQLGLES
ncbi:MAG: ABC transporter substrate-binding protein [Clostridiales bacterium]|jgi:ABC-type glycerol-3-phosphate transport system substrate-binding protein|nr:ABC transporter substrate-binding protein [Clostridiales bacterium]